MNLKSYLDRERMSVAEFARVAGFKSRQVVHSYLSGERFPTPENLKRIRVATDGAVTADDFVDQHTATPAGEAAA